MELVIDSDAIVTAGKGVRRSTRRRTSSNISSISTIRVARLTLGRILEVQGSVRVVWPASDDAHDA